MIKIRFIKEDYSANRIPIYLVVPKMKIIYKFIPYKKPNVVQHSIEFFYMNVLNLTHRDVIFYDCFDYVDYVVRRLKYKDYPVLSILSITNKKGYKFIISS